MSIRYNDHEVNALDTKATWSWLLLDSKPIKVKLDLKQWGLVATGNCLYLSKLWEPGLERIWESSRENVEIWLLLGRTVFALALREPLKWTQHGLKTRGGSLGRGLGAQSSFPSEE